MKIIITLIIIGLISLGILFSTYSPLKETKINNPQPSSAPSVTDIATPEIVNYKASFEIHTNRTIRVFSDPRYHNLSPDVYIEAANPNVVIVKKSQVTWQDFFNTLPMKLEKECLTTGTGQVFCSGSDGKLEFFINGVKEENALNIVINDGDKLLVKFEAN